MNRFQKGRVSISAAQSPDPEQSHRVNRGYLLAHSVDDFKVFGIGEQGVRVHRDVVVEQRHHICETKQEGVSPSGHHILPAVNPGLYFS